ncbi:MAG: ATP-binding protein [Cyanobacteria bacterium J06650_10]
MGDCKTQNADDFTGAEDTLFEQVVITSPLTVSPTASVTETIAKMHQQRSSYAIIADRQPTPQREDQRLKQHLLGLFTERDLVRAVTSQQPFAEVEITAIMDAQAPTILKKDITSATAIFRLMRQQKVRHLPVIKANGLLAGLITQDSILQALNSENSQQMVALLQQEIMQLRTENQTLREARNRELEQWQSLSCGESQLSLSSRLENKQLEQQQPQEQLEMTYHELEKSHDALSKTNTELNETLQELQSTKQTLQQTNIELEHRVDQRTSDLLRVEGRWRSLLEEVPLVVIGLDLEGKVNYANPFFLQITGYSAEEVLERSWFKNFVPHDEQDHTYQYFQTFINSREIPLHYQNEILTRSGSARMIAWHNVTLRDRINNIIGTMSIGEDITDRLAVDRMKGEFVSVVSHELRTPLTAIHGGLKLITSGLVASDSLQGKELLQVAAESSQRLVRLVNDILELERLESGKAQLSRKRILSQEITAQVARVFKVAASTKQIAIAISDPGLVLMADCDRLIQVLTNLLDNAIKFSPKSTTIKLSVEHRYASAKEEATALFKVKDEGKGIPSEDLLEIFKRFTQVNYDDSREKGGTGLGLAICHNIIRQHGGKIWVESTLGKGSCFYFTVPLFSH